MNAPVQNIKALGPYEFEPLDLEKNFPAPLLYIGWDDHLSFCAPHCVPLPGDTPFAALTGPILASMYGAHPDFERIDWDQVQWFKSGQPWQPQRDRTLAENGLRHKDAIRFRTPGLTGIGGSHS